MDADMVLTGGVVWCGLGRPRAEAEARAAQAIRTLVARIAQLDRDLEREAGLNRDAGEVIARLGAERQDLEQAGRGHDDRLAAAGEAADEAAEAADGAAQARAVLTKLVEATPGVTEGTDRGAWVGG